MNQTNRNNNFGILHLAASLFVMYGHEYNLLNQASPSILGNQAHAIGVKIIFLISGYLITKSLFSMKGSRMKVTIIYTIKRVGRLLPEMLFCLIITAFIIVPIFSTLTFKEYFQNMNSILFYIKRNLLLYPVFYLPGVFETNPLSGTVNGSLWTLPVEFSMYIFLLFMGVLFQSINKRKVVHTIWGIGVFVLWCIKNLFLSDTSFVFYGTDWGAALNIIIYFVIGSEIYLWNIQKIFDIQKTLFLVLIFCIFKFNTGFITEIACMITLTCSVFSLGFAGKQSLKTNKIHTEYAYGIYLWSFPVQQCIISLFIRAGKLQSPNFLFVLSAIITYIVASFSYICVYKPFKKMNTKLLKYIDIHM